MGAVRPGAFPRPIMGSCKIPGEADGMRRYLLAALWPAGLAAIAAATVTAARRAPAPPSPAVDPPGPGEAGPPAVAAEPSGTAAEPSGTSEPAAACSGDWARDLIRLGAISGAGGALSYGVL